MASSKRNFLFEDKSDAVMTLIDVDMLGNKEEKPLEMEATFKKKCHLQKNISNINVSFVEKSANLI